MPVLIRPSVSSKSPILICWYRNRRRGIVRHDNRHELPGRVHAPARHVRPAGRLGVRPHATWRWPSRKRKWPRGGSGPADVRGRVHVRGVHADHNVRRGVLHQRPLPVCVRTKQAPPVPDQRVRHSTQPVRFPHVLCG